MKLRILLADDHKIIREGIRHLIAKERDMEVVGEAENGRSAVELAKKLAPDIILMDISMPVMNGIEATRAILAKNAKAKVICLSMYGDKRFLSEMFSGGACGYLMKDCKFEEIAAAIRAVTSGQVYLAPRIAGGMVKDYLLQASREETRLLSSLTPREREVLQLIAEGKTTKQIAVLCKVSIKTIETHRIRIMKKLEIYNLPQLTKYAIREGITSLET